MIFLSFFVEVRGVEPLTYCMPCNRSSQLSYTPIESAAKIEKISLQKKAYKKKQIHSQTKT